MCRVRDLALDRPGTSARRRADERSAAAGVDLDLLGPHALGLGHGQGQDAVLEGRLHLIGLDFDREGQRARERAVAVLALVVARLRRRPRARGISPRIVSWSPVTVMSMSSGRTPGIDVRATSASGVS